MSYLPLQHTKLCCRDQLNHWQYIKFHHKLKTSIGHKKEKSQMSKDQVVGSDLVPYQWISAEGVKLKQSTFGRIRLVYRRTQVKFAVGYENRASLYEQFSQIAVAFPLESKEEDVHLNPDLAFWTQLNTNDGGHTDKSQCLGHFYGHENGFLCLNRNSGWQQ